MAVEQMNPQGGAQAAQARGTVFPGFALASCIEAVRVLQTHGGQATADHFASYLNYKGTNNGAYLTRVASCKAFNLLTKTGQMFVPTALAQRIISPVYPQDQHAALVESFMAADLFRRIYEDFKGKELPPEFGMKNALRNIYGVKPERINDCYRILMESAETAGFFATRNGARTHLIIPMVQPAAGQVPPGGGNPDPEPADLAGMGGGGDGGAGFVPPPSPPPASGGSRQAGSTGARDAYLNVLIGLFEKKAAEGDMDEKLMERIERLLGEKGSA